MLDKKIKFVKDVDRLTLLVNDYYVLQMSVRVEHPMDSVILMYILCCCSFHQRTVQYTVMP